MAESCPVAAQLQADGAWCETSSSHIHTQNWIALARLAWCHRLILKPTRLTAITSWSGCVIAICGASAHPSFTGPQAEFTRRRSLDQAEWTQRLTGKTTLNLVL